MAAGCGSWRDEIDLAIAGALDPARSRAFKAHLEVCAPCRQAVAESYTAFSLVGLSATQVTTDPAVRARLEARLNRPAPHRRLVGPIHEWSPLPGWVAAATCLFAVILLSFERWELEREIHSANAQIRDYNSALRPAPIHVYSAPSLPPAPAPVPVNLNEFKGLQQALRDAQSKIQTLEAARNAAAEQTLQLQAALATAQQSQRELAEKAETIDSQRRDAEEQLASNAPPPPSSVPDRSAGEALRLEEELRVTRQRLDRQTQQLSELRRLFAVLESPGVRQIQLRGVEKQAGSGNATALWSPGSGLLLYARNLPPLPAGKCYQLWVLRDAKPSIESAGLVWLDAQGGGVLYARPSDKLSRVTGFAITDEPDGGSPSATGKRLFSGAL
jgi:anti-sigma-K factor RskA